MKKKILICEDDKSLQEIFKFLFRKEETDILTLSDGSDIFSTAKEHSPSVILLDLMMPGKDGLWALKELRGDPVTAAIPVVVVSCEETLEKLKQARALGAREFVRKPFETNHVLETVRKYLGGAAAGK